MNEEQRYFNKIAEGYQALDTGSTPVRKFSEVPSLLKYAQPLAGAAILELACSDGFFSRLLKNAGAASVLAMDLSPQMIELACLEEARKPLGIAYRVGSVLEMGVLGQFDMVFSPFVMSYAKDRQELLAMCRALYRNLKPGGRLLSMNDNPSLLPDSETGFSKYGKIKRIAPPVQDGARLTVTWVAPDSNATLQSLAFECRYYTRESLEWALTEAGFVDVCIHHPEVSPEGLAAYGQAYWALFLEHPLLVFIAARRP
ncbi:MAG: class I SAM-dependent methyltransferase [Gallionellaceae bacterium]|nr:class I SAM-dependent methyltransferase [Gallionellaceae bacterium]